MNKILTNHGEEYKVDKINGYAEGYAKLNSSDENKKFNKLVVPDLGIPVIKTCD